MKKLNQIIYVVLQLTWGCLQTLVGGFIFLLHCKQTHFFYHGAVVTRWSGKNSLSMGLFLFVADHLERDCCAHILHHEFGHTIQSIVLGPLYLLLIGVPSFIWCNLPYFRKMRAEKGVLYDAFWIEAQASRLGEKLSRKLEKDA